MSIAVDLVRTTLHELIIQRREVMGLACRQRAKWEGWLKFELAAALGQQNGFENVILEDSYPDGKRSDLSFQLAGAKYFVELKTSNVNWRAEGLENRTRPITRNVSRIIDDLLKLRQIPANCRGLSVFCLFPIPARIWTYEQEKLNKHLGRIEEKCGLSRGSLILGGEYDAVTDEFGVCTFIIEIAK